MTEKNFKEAEYVERLEKQNEKVRNELKALKAQLEIIRKTPENVLKTQERLSSLAEANSPRVKKIKDEIRWMKKELEGNECVKEIADLENQSKFLTTRIQELETELQDFKLQEKKHKKALTSAHEANTYPEKIHQLKQDIKNAREKYKQLASQLTEDEKNSKSLHEKCVNLEKKCRKIYDSLKSSEKKKQKNSENPQGKISDLDIQILEEKIRKTQENNKNDEQVYRKNITELETFVREAKHHLEMLKIKNKEKDQECRLGLLKVKELKKTSKFKKSTFSKDSKSNTPRNGSLPPLRDSAEFPDKKSVQITDLKPVSSSKTPLPEKRDSAKYHLFHQETLKIIEKMNKINLPNF